MPSISMYDYRFKPWEIYGGKRPFFVKYAELIKDIIKDFKLEPVKEQFLSSTVRETDYKSSEKMAYFDPGIYGGKRFAHLHYKGEVYMLNKEQWQAFTARVKDDFISRLKMSNHIPIEQMIDLSDAIDPIV